MTDETIESVHFALFVPNSQTSSREKQFFLLTNQLCLYLPLIAHRIQRIFLVQMERFYANTQRINSS